MPGAICSAPRGTAGDSADGPRPGDPAKAAQVIIKVVGMDDPPIRLLLGSDALKIVQTADARKAAADRKWSALSASTDFVAAKT